jgi:hypothetical protein
MLSLMPFTGVLWLSSIDILVKQIMQAIPPSKPLSQSQSLIPTQADKQDLQATKAMLPERAEWPGWDVPRTFNWWLAAIGYLMGVVGFVAVFFPSISKFALLAVLLVLVSPILAAINLYVGRIIRTTYRRLEQYNALCNTLERRDETIQYLEQQLEETKSVLLNASSELFASNRLRVDRVQLHRGRVYLRLDSESTVIHVGDQVILIDTLDGVLFGTFEISEVDGNRATAQNISNLDAVWSGDLHQSSNSESFPPPNSAAIIFKRGRA